MIYTCTLSPSIDYVIQLDEFTEGALNRAKKTYYYPGGKGINVSRILKRLDIDNIALGYIGGFTGDFIKGFLNNEKVTNQFIEVNDTTRINVKVKADNETEINGPGPHVTEEQQIELLNHVEALGDGDILVLAGSLPSTLPNNFYNQIAELCQKRQVKLVADTSGEALKDIISFRPFLIKPNHHELGQLFQTEIHTPEEAIYYAKKLLEKGVTNVIVSMGGLGAVFVNEQEQLFATVPKGQVKNSVGAGDSVVSGFIAAYSKGTSLMEAFHFGVAAGSATAFSNDLCEKDAVEVLLPQINITTIKGEGI